jgi:hypothetical protein
MSDLTMLVTPLRAGLKAAGRATLDVLVQVQGSADVDLEATFRHGANHSGR